MFGHRAAAFGSAHKEPGRIFVPLPVSRTLQKIDRSGIEAGPVRSSPLGFDCSVEPLAPISAVGASEPQDEQIRPKQPVLGESRSYRVLRRLARLSDAADVDVGKARIVASQRITEPSAY